MPFRFILPTTSSFNLGNVISSHTHPLLPLSASTSRGVVRDALKKHKQSPAQGQSSDLHQLSRVLTDYIPYLIALNSALNGVPVGKEQVSLTRHGNIETTWRDTLAASLPGLGPPRIKVRGLEPEIHFVIVTIAHINMLLARDLLYGAQSHKGTTSEQRTAAMVGATRYFLEANAQYRYLYSRPQRSGEVAIVMSRSALDALASLALAEATLVAVLKDDPFPGIEAQDRDPQSTEWMYVRHDIPKVRAYLFVRLCLAAAEHATRAHASLAPPGRVDEALVDYLENLSRTARGKAFRFLAVDAEMAGKTGEAIAWLRIARKELGFAKNLGDENQTNAFARIKKDWAEKREDRKFSRGEEWGSDAGRFREGRVVDMLEKKWVKMNDMVNVQTIPPAELLLAQVPSSRECHTPKSYQPPELDADELLKMEATPPLESFQDQTYDSSDDEAEGKPPIGAFPGTAAEYSDGSSYY